MFVFFPVTFLTFSYIFLLPCLRIEQDNDIRWLYESSDIIAYLKTLWLQNAKFRAVTQVFRQERSEQEYHHLLNKFDAV